MDSKFITDMLGDKVPNALKAFKELEQGLAPVLAQVAANRDNIPRDQLAQLDKALAEIEEQKIKMRQHGA